MPPVVIRTTASARFTEDRSTARACERRAELSEAYRSSSCARVPRPVMQRDPPRRARRLTSVAPTNLSGCSCNCNLRCICSMSRKSTSKAGSTPKTLNTSPAAAAGAGCTLPQCEQKNDASSQPPPQLQQTPEAGRGEHVSCGVGSERCDGAEQTHEHSEAATHQKRAVRPMPQQPPLVAQFCRAQEMGHVQRERRCAGPLPAWLRTCFPNKPIGRRRL